MEACDKLCRNTNIEGKELRPCASGRKALSSMRRSCPNRIAPRALAPSTLPTAASTAHRGDFIQSQTLRGVIEEI